VRTPNSHPIPGRFAPEIFAENVKTGCEKEGRGGENVGEIGKLL